MKTESNPETGTGTKVAGTATKKASDLKVGDKFIRFGHTMTVKGVARRIHPHLKRETVTVQHELATIDYVTNHLVEVPVTTLDGEAIGGLV